jgi:tetratricopeptide (TPR) repeat protein
MTIDLKGDLILKEVTGQDAEARLTASLQKIFSSTPPDRILALLAKPKPFVLIQGISEPNARKLIEMLQAQGAALEFRPLRSEPNQPEAPTRTPAPSPSPTPPSTPPAPAISPSVKTESGISKPAAPIKTPTGTLTAKRKGKPKKEKHSGSGKHSTFRTVLRRARIAVLLLFLLGTVGIAFQVYVLKVSPVYLFQVAQDKLNTMGLAKTGPTMEGGPASEVLQVLYTPPPSVLSVDVKDIRSAYDALHLPRPDRRFLLAFDSLTRRWAQAAGIKPGKYGVSTSRDGANQIILDLTRGRKVLHRTAMPLPTSFPVLMSALEQWNNALDASLDKPRQTLTGPVQDSKRLLGARQLLDAVDPRFAMMALNVLEEIYRKEGGHPVLYLEAARAYTTLCFLLDPDKTMRTDELAAEALAFLSLARHAQPELVSDETEAFIAAEMGYKGHAIELLESSARTEGTRRARILAAYLKEDMTGLKEIIQNPVQDASQVLGEYLNVRLLRELGLNVEAKEAAMELLGKWPFYPAIIEVIRVGDLNLAKVLTILYPLDILWALESNSNLEAYDESTLEERFKAFEGKSEGDVINIARFEGLLEKWDVFAKEERPLLFVDEDRVRRVFGVMYMDALYLRFNLLLNRWSVAENAQTFAASVAVGSENAPLAHYMQGMAARNLGDQAQARLHFKAILENPESRKRMAGDAYWNSGPENIYKLLPHVYMQLDGRPWDRSYWGQILSDKLQDLDGALSVFREALDQNPFLYHLYKKLAETSGSDSALTRAVQQYPYSYALLEEAADHFKTRNDLLSQEKALNYYSRALEMVPSRRSLASEKGQTLKRLNRYKEAVQVYTKWIEDYGTGNLGEVIMKAGRAEALRKMGRPEEALLSMDGGEKSYQAGAMLQAAMCYEEMGKHKQAAEWFFRAAERYENSASIAVDCVRFLWKMREYEAAAKMLQRNRKNAGNNSYWYVDEFSRVFAVAPVEDIRSAVTALKKFGATSNELMTISHVLERKGRLELAFEIASNTQNSNVLLSLENVTVSYKFLRKLKGKEAASNYLWREVASQTRMKDMILITLLSSGGSHMFLEEVGNPDSYEYPEYAWLLTLAAWKATDGESGDWGRKIDFHYMKESGIEPYYSIGSYILGKISREELLSKIVTPKRRVEIPYFMGLMERLKGNFEEANVWYQLCMMTGLENNLEYHTAGNELFYWAHLGTGGRNRLPGDDRDAVRRKMILRESDIALL